MRGIDNDNTKHDSVGFLIKYTADSGEIGGGGGVAAFRIDFKPLLVFALPQVVSTRRVGSYADFSNRSHCNTTHIVSFVSCRFS